MQVVVAGFYTAWLLPASFVGVAVFLYGVFSMGHNTPAYVSTILLLVQDNFYFYFRLGIAMAML